MKSQVIFGYLLVLLLACKNDDKLSKNQVKQVEQNSQMKLEVPIVSADSITADYTIQAIQQNRGFAVGITTADLVAQKGKALHFVKKVLKAEWGGLGNKDVVDIYFDDDSSYYKVDYYPYSGSDYQRPTTLHLLFFPRTKKMFFFHYGDTLVTSELLYDTLKFKYQPTLKK